MITPRAKRKIAVNVQHILYNNRRFCDYHQLRPMKTRTINSVEGLEKALPHRLPMDCSEAVTLVCHIAGFKDPSGNSYDGYGDTQTMLDNLKHHYRDARDANAGAIVIFNANMPLAEQHVGQVNTADKLHGNPIIFTHGHQGDPNLVRLFSLQPGFSGETIFLSVTELL